MISLTEPPCGWGAHGPTAPSSAAPSQAWLPVVVAGLGNLGFTGRPIGRRRPRRLDKATWAALSRAAEQTGFAAPELLRATLELAGGAEPSQPPGGGKG